MSITIVQQRLESYKCQTPLEEENAIKEITQEIALLGLSRAGFFKDVEFHGGTALRILYGLQRFSEDLDFATLKPDNKFELNKYLKPVADEFNNYGYDVEIQDRSKADRVVQKAFLKDDSIGRVLLLQYPQPIRSSKKIQIKFEVDTNPPLGAETEIKYLDFPFPFTVQTKNLPSSFSGKIHALLCRPYLKGRDWYDFIWYIAQNIGLNYQLLTNAINQIGPWQKQNILINKDWVLTQLDQKIQSIDWQKAAEDVRRFLRPNEQEALGLWSEDFFLSRLEKLSKI